MPSGRLGGARREGVDVDSDRESADARDAPLRRDRIIDQAQPELADQIVREVLDVVVGLEADQVIGEHRLHEIAVVRNVHDRAPARPGRVQEEADGAFDPQAAQFLAERQEVVVVNPIGRVRPAEAQQPARHEGVDLAIAVVIVDRCLDQIRAGMQGGPKDRIRESLVVAFVVSGRQVDSGDGAGPQRLDLGEGVLVRGVAQPPARPDPDCAGTLNDRKQRTREATADRFVQFGFRHPVRNDNEAHAPLLHTLTIWNSDHLLTFGTQ